MRETGLLPHINAGCMTPGRDRLAETRVGIDGHHARVGFRAFVRKRPRCINGSPDKHPRARLAHPGRRRPGPTCPLPPGILIGIGETRQEIIDSLLAIRELHERYGHIQEIIIQNFVPKADTKMASVTPPGEDDLLWTIAMARRIFGPEMSIQAPPNLNPGRLQALVDAGINDWGGVSPLTPDHVNPESPWPHLDTLVSRRPRGPASCCRSGLRVYPFYLRDGRPWLNPDSRRYALRLSDAQGLGREDDWVTGHSTEVPDGFRAPGEGLARGPAPSRQVEALLRTALDGERDLEDEEVASLFRARGRDFDAVCRAADQLRRSICGDTVTYVVNRNINYTNICTYRCKFCAFAKGRKRTAASDAPYLKPPEEVAALAVEAWQRGARPRFACKAVSTRRSRVRPTWTSSRRCGPRRRTFTYTHSRRSR